MGDFEESSGKSGTVKDNLSPEEIQELLQQGQEEAAPQGLELLTSAKNISYERLPMLEVVFDRLIRVLTTTLRNFTNENVELSLQYIRSTRYGTYLEEVETPGIFVVVKLREWGTSALLYVNNKLIFSLVEVLLGGRKTETTSMEGRPYTSLERSLIERFSKVVLNDMTLAFEPIERINYDFDRLETNPAFLSIVQPTNASIKVRLNVNMDRRGGCFEFLIPYASIEPAREKLLQMFMGEKFGQDNIWETHLARELWETNLVTDVILSERKISLAEVLLWKKGDFLPLEVKPDAEVTLKCKDKAILTGNIGNINRHVALKVKTNLLSSEE